MLSWARGQMMTNAIRPAADTENQELARPVLPEDGRSITPGQMAIASERRESIERYIKETVRHYDAHIAATAARFQESLDSADAAIAEIDAEYRIEA